MKVRISKRFALSLVLAALDVASACSPDDDPPCHDCAAQGGAHDSAGAGGSAAESNSGGVNGGAEAGQGGQAGAGGGPSELIDVLVVSAAALGEPAGLYALDLLPARNDARLLTHAVAPGSDVVSFSVAPDGRRVAFVVAAANVGALDVYVVDTDGANTRQLSPDGLADGLAYVIGWSPSGASLAFHHDGHFYAARVDGSALCELPSRDFSWTRDEAQVVYAQGNDVLVSALDGENPRIVAQASTPISIAGWSSGGKWLMTASRATGSPALRAWNMLDGSVRDLPSHPTQFPLWSPRNESLYAWLDTLGNAGVSSLDSAWILALDGNAISRLSWSPNGALLAQSGEQLQLVEVGVAGGGDPVRIEPNAATGSAPAFSWAPDSRSVVYATRSSDGLSEEVLVRSVEPSTEALRMSGAATPNSSVRSFGFSPNSAVVVYQADHRQLGTDELAVTEVASGRHLVLGHVNDVSLPRDDSTWSRSARYLAFQVDSKLTALELESFDSLPLEGRLPLGVHSRAFDFGVEVAR